MIGIVGGVGPYTGIDLLKKIFDNTLAGKDQEHLNIMLLSLSSQIEDHTKFLEGEVEINPGFAIAEVMLQLEKAGVTISGVPCNTAHSESIFGATIAKLKLAKSKLKVLHMVEETVFFISENYPNFTKIGLLSTTGMYKGDLYGSLLQKSGYEIVFPTLEMQESIIHPAIYDEEYGIKSMSNPIHSKAKENLLQGVAFLKQQGAQLVILGCSEISLAIAGSMIDGLVAVDPTNILARALIQQSRPCKLKPLTNILCAD
jgi:aspartate racemase